MSISLNSNIAALRAERRLNQGSETLSRVYERLSSGQRINRASDDAAGLSVATSLNISARVFSQGLRNANDGLSLLAIADGALTQMGTIVTRQKELAEQAANGIYGSEQRNAMQVEVTELTNEYNRILATSEFNGTPLFASTATDMRLQLGFGIEESLAFSIGGNLLHTVPNGKFAETAQNYSSGGFGTNPWGGAVADLNGDNRLDIITTDFGANRVSVLLGNGNGSFNMAVTYVTGSLPTDVTISDVNKDGSLDLAVTDSGTNSVVLFIGNGDGSFKAASTLTTGTGAYSITANDINHDGNPDIISTATAAGRVDIFIGNGNGTFKARVSYVTGSAPRDVIAADLDGDSNVDLLVSEFAGGSISFFKGVGGGTFQARVSYSVPFNALGMVLGDFNNDAQLDVAVGTDAGTSAFLVLGNGNGTFRAWTTIDAGLENRQFQTGDFNADGNLDLIAPNWGDNYLSVVLGNGNGSFQARTSYPTGFNPKNVVVGDFNSDGITDVVSLDTNSDRLGVRLGSGILQNTISAPLISDRASALHALDTLSARLDSIALERGSIGSVQSRLTQAVASLAAKRENYLTAASRILDADIAEESAQLTKQQILQKVSAAILGQANQQPALALQLLKGG